MPGLWSYCYREWIIVIKTQKSQCLLKQRIFKTQFMKAFKTFTEGESLIEFGGALRSLGAAEEKSHRHRLLFLF